MIGYISPSLFRASFDTVEDFAHRAQQSEMLTPCGESLGRSSRENDTSRSWDLNTDFASAVRLALNGWIEGGAKIRTLVDKIGEVVKPRAHQMDFVYGVEGTTPDVSRYLQGDPECMLSFVPPDEPRKVLPVYVSCTLHAAEVSEKSFRRGASICAAIDMMEASGFECELYSVDGASQHHPAQANPGCQCATMVRVKEAGQPLSLERAGFALAHPAFLRRLMFGVQETLPIEVRENVGYHELGGYGYPVHDIETLLTDDEKADAIIFKGNSHEYDSDDIAIELTQDFLKSQGLIDEE